MDSAGTSFILSLFIGITICLPSISTRADLDPPYSATPPAPGAYTVSNGDARTFGVWTVQPTARLLVIDSGNPGALSFDTMNVTRGAGGYISFFAQASGNVHFSYTLTGEGAGFFSWFAGSTASASETNLVLEPREVSFPVESGELITFWIGATGQDFLTSIIRARRLLTIFGFSAPVSTAAPLLTITNGRPLSFSVTLSWPVSSGPYFLESAISSTQQSLTWNPVIDPISIESAQYKVTVSNVDPARFFRLHAR